MSQSANSSCLIYLEVLHFSSWAPEDYNYYRNWHGFLNGFGCRVINTAIDLSKVSLRLYFITSLEAASDINFVSLWIKSRYLSQNTLQKACCFFVYSAMETVVST